MTTAPVISISAASLAYSNVLTGSTATQAVTIGNSGTAPLNFAGFTIAGSAASSYSVSTTCGTQLAVGSTCVVSVAFTPVLAGAYAATLNIADNAGISPQTVALSGTAVTPPPSLGLSAQTLSFTQPAQSTSVAQTLTLTNTGGQTLTIAGIALPSTSPANFTISSMTCGSSLAINASCTVSVVFTPFLSTSYTSSLTISTNANVPVKVIPISGTGAGTLSINTSNANDWVITTGAVKLDWNSTTGRIFSVHLTGYSDELVDTTTTQYGQPDGLYMDNTGTGSGTTTSGYVQTGSYIDWWITTQSNSANAFTSTKHFIVSANDTGFHVFSSVAHSASDIAGGLGQWQYVFRVSKTLFTETYTVNGSLGNIGVLDVPLYSPTLPGLDDPGRAVQDATVDLHGLTLPAGFRRQFYTKYDHAGYEYLHREHGIYGSQYGAWLLVPRSETLSGGPTKQDLFFTGNLLMMEAFSGHLDNNLSYTPPQGVDSSRLFGPYYFHFNALSSANPTGASLYAEAAKFEPYFDQLYDADSALQDVGYAASTARGSVAAAIQGGGSATPYAGWTVLSDPNENFQYSSNGYQYWVNDNAAGNQPLVGVIPGTYRLSSYVLGQWGELRLDGVQVVANVTTTPAGLTFTPENFGTAPPVWTIGTPDRSAHEFLHGHDTDGSDLKNYWGAYNYWADFASTKGQEIYYATAVGSTPATNDLNKINYTWWQTFDPGLYAGVYNAADTTSDGYQYALPSYVSNVTASVPAVMIHFTSTAAQLAQGRYAVLSLGLASAEASVVATLNGHALTWRLHNASDAGIRSGLSGTYQWVAFQWDASQLSAAGADNVLTLGVSQPQGVQPDALRFEITSTSASPAVTNWHDYDWLYGSQSITADDSAANNGK
ncbi:choice-of-anchor D domain-containing protein [Granulicella rosea]|nr:choice-of-anchor D domain-containing protein [Granulicella rosea]